MPLDATLPPPSTQERRPLANDRPPRPDAPRARRLRRRDADIRARGHAHFDAYRYAKPYPDTYPYAYVYACANRNPYPHAYAYRNTHTDAYAYGHPFTNAHANSGAIPGGRDRAALQLGVPRRACVCLDRRHDQ